MTSLVIANAARDSMMQLTDQNRFTRSLSGGYKMANGSRVRKLFFKNQRSHQESIVRESTELATVDKRVEDGGSMAMPNEFYKKQCHV